MDCLKRLAVDGITLTGHASYLLSMRRREAIKPLLNPRYHGLCSKSVPITDGLFGNNLATTLKTVSEAFDVGRKVANSKRSGVSTSANRDRPTMSRRGDHDFSAYQRDFQASRRDNFRRSRAPATFSRPPQIGQQTNYSRSKRPYNKFADSSARSNAKN